MSKERKILFDPTLKQEEFINAVFSGDYVLVFFGGSIRGGKSYSLLGLFIILCHLFPGSKYVVCRSSIEILKSTTLKSFRNLVPSSITRKMPTQGNEWEWVHNNGSVIKFFSENISHDPDLMRFRGLEYDALGFDELDVTEATFRKAFERLGTWKMDERKASMEAGEPIPPRVVIGTSNPQDGWVKKEIYEKYIEGTLPKKWLYIVSKVYDNPHIPPDWIQMLRDTMLPEDFEMFVEGNWDINKNKMKYFTHYSDKIHYSKNNKFPINQNAETWLIFDFNYDPTTCTVYQAFDTHILCVREYGIQGGTRTLCTLMKNDAELMSMNTLFWTISGDTSGSSHTSTGGDQTDYAIIQEMFMVMDSQFINVHTRNKALTYSRRLCDHFLYKVPFAIDGSVTRLRDDLLKAKPIEGTNDLYKDRKKGFGMDFLDTFRYFVDAKFPDGVPGIERFAEICKIKRKEMEDRKQRMKAKKGANV